MTNLSIARFFLITCKTVKLLCLLLNNIDIKNCMIGSLTDKTAKMLAAFYSPK